MDVVEYLEQLKVISTRIKLKELEIKNLEDKIYSARSINNSGVRTSASRNQYNLIDRHIDKVSELQKEIKEYEKAESVIKKQIESLRKPEYIEVLYKRYVEFKSIGEIAYEMGYSVSNVKKLRKKAIRTFAKLVLNYT